MNKSVKKLLKTVLPEPVVNVLKSVKRRVILTYDNISICLMRANRETQYQVLQGHYSFFRETRNKFRQSIWHWDWGIYSSGQHQGWLCVLWYILKSSRNGQCISAQRSVMSPYGHIMTKGDTMLKAVLPESFFMCCWYCREYIQENRP